MENCVCGRWPPAWQLAVSGTYVLRTSIRPTTERCGVRQGNPSSYTTHQPLHCWPLTSDEYPAAETSVHSTSVGHPQPAMTTCRCSTVTGFNPYSLVSLVKSLSIADTMTNADDQLRFKRLSSSVANDTLSNPTNFQWCYVLEVTLASRTKFWPRPLSFGLGRSLGLASIS